MSTYSQFNYPYATTVSQLPTATSAAPSTVMSSVTGTGTGGSTACCETGRPVATDPVTGQVICSCQYESARLSLNSYAPRLGSGTALSYGTASYPSTEHNPYPSIGVDSAAYFSQFTTPYGLKEGAPGDVAMYGSIGGSPGYGYTYDPSLYGYGAPYDLAARRKNATREATGTLKAWLNEHKTNPYPTKGEKIMLAIITKMTLTQVSTWFANARRRLKKENKMTWEPKTKADSDDDGDKGSDAAESVDKELEEDKDSLHTSLVSNVPSLPKSHLKTEVLSPEDDCKESIFSDDCSDLQKPKIWSLADTAACKSPANQGAWSTDRVPPQGASAASTFPLPASIPPYNRFNQRQSYSMSSTGGYRQMTTAGTSLSESGSPHDSSSAAMSPGVYGHQAGPSATGGSAASSLHYTAGSSVYGGGTSGLQHPVSSHQTGSMYSSGAPVDAGGGASAVFSTGSPVDSYKTELQGGPELLQSRYRLPCHQSAAGSSGSQSAYQSMSQSTPHSLQLPPSAAAHHMI